MSPFPKDLSKDAVEAVFLREPETQEQMPLVIYLNHFIGIRLMPNVKFYFRRNHQTDTWQEIPEKALRETMRKYDVIIGKKRHSVLELWRDSIHRHEMTAEETPEPAPKPETAKERQKRKVANKMEELHDAIREFAETELEFRSSFSEPSTKVHKRFLTWYAETKGGLPPTLMEGKEPAKRLTPAFVDCFEISIGKNSKKEFGGLRLAKHGGSGSEGPVGLEGLDD